MKKHMLFTLKNILLSTLTLTLPAFACFTNQTVNNTNIITTKNTETSESIINENKKQKNTPLLSPAETFIIAAPAAFCMNNILDYISTFVHEHGHGLASGHPYEIKLNTNFISWGGKCIPKENFECTTLKAVIILLAGPLTGLCTMYLQNIGIEMLDGALEKRPWKESLRKGLCYPFSFFSYLKSKLQDNSTEKNDHQNTLTLAAKMSLNTLRIMTWIRFATQIMEGFTPLNIPNSDGLRVWKTIVGENCPTINPDPGITLAILAPLLIINRSVVWNKLKSAPYAIWNAFKEEWND